MLGKKFSFVKCKIGNMVEDVKSQYQATRFLFMNEKASASIAASVISFFVILFFGAMLLAKIQPSITGTDAATNASIASLVSTSWSYFALLVLIPLAMAFSAIMYYLGGGSK